MSAKVMNSRNLASNAAGVVDPMEDYMLVPRPKSVGPSGGSDEKAKAKIDIKVEPPEGKLQAGSRRVGAAIASVSRGLKPLRLMLPYSFSLSASAAGLVAGVSVLQVDSNTVEWADLVGLYSQFKVHGGLVKYFLAAPSLSVPAGGLTPDSMFVLVYDPGNSTALSSVRQGVEAAFHDLRVPSYTTTTSASSAAAGAVLGFQSANGKPYTLSFKCKPALQIVSGAVSEVPGTWVACAASGSNPGQGFLKAYGQFGTSTGVYPVVMGMVMVDVEFRNRL